MKNNFGNKLNHDIIVQEVYMKKIIIVMFILMGCFVYAQDFSESAGPDYNISSKDYVFNQNGEDWFLMTDEQKYGFIEGYKGGLFTILQYRHRHKGDDLQDEEAERFFVVMDSEKLVKEVTLFYGDSYWDRWNSAIIDVVLLISGGAYWEGAYEE
jgi:hypothetical protein